MRTVTDMFEPYIGTKEYDGIVALIQKWFYGSMYKGAWCATSMSYFMNELGLLEQIGGKNENVYCMLKACEAVNRKRFKHKNEIPEGYRIKRGTIIFNLNSGTVMTESSSKHVTSAYADFDYNPAKSYKGLGGNQSDMIRISEYTQKKIYAIFEPPYKEESGHPVLRKGDKGEAVAELQADLNALGVTDKNGKALAIDSSFGGLTESAVKNFQKSNGLKVDGICGAQTWGKIDALIKSGRKVKVTTLLNCRTGAGTEYPVKRVLKTGEVYTCVKQTDGWDYLAEPEGWVSSKFVTEI